MAEAREGLVRSTASKPTLRRRGLLRPEHHDDAQGGRLRLEPSASTSGLVPRARFEPNTISYIIEAGRFPSMRCALDAGRSTRTSGSRPDRRARFERSFRLRRLSPPAARSRRERRARIRTCPPRRPLRTNESRRGFRRSNRHCACRRFPARWLPVL